MVDEVIGGMKLSSSTKSLITRVLGDLTSGGNKAAPMRKRELQEISELADRLWDAAGAETATQQGQYEENQTILVQQHIGNGTLTEVGSDDARGPSRRPESVTNAGLAQVNENLGDFLALGETADLMPPLSTSSADFARTFDFSQEQMVSLADHLDVNALPTMLDFSGQSLDEWL